MQEPIPGTPTSVLRMGSQKNPQPGMWFGLAYGSGGGGGVTEKTWAGGGGLSGRGQDIYAGWPTCTLNRFS